MDSVTFNNKQWPIRNVYVDGDWLTVASDKLEQQLRDPDGNYVSGEAELVDEVINYYVPSKKFGKADNVLHNYIVKTFM